MFRLSADGLDRTYQVEPGTVLWSLPKALDLLPSYGKNEGLVEQLGPKGPWIVERLIGMREFPRAMDFDGRATMLENCVRRACQTAGGERVVDLHKHVLRGRRLAGRSAWLGRAFAAVFVAIAANGAANNAAVASGSEDGPEPPVAATASTAVASEPHAPRSSCASASEPDASPKRSVA